MDEFANYMEGLDYCAYNMVHERGPIELRTLSQMEIVLFRA
jgi:hypothetical protein